MAYKNFSIHCVLLVFLCALLSNSLAWAFHGEIFMHVLDNNHQHSHESIQEAHKTSSNKEFFTETELAVSINTCLNAAYQPFFLTKPLHALPPPIIEVFIEFISEPITNTHLDSPFRPPRNFFYS